MAWLKSTGGERRRVQSEASEVFFFNYLAYHTLALAFLGASFFLHFQELPSCEGSVRLCLEHAESYAWREEIYSAPGVEPKVEPARGYAAPLRPTCAVSSVYPAADNPGRLLGFSYAALQMFMYFFLLSNAASAPAITTLQCLLLARALAKENCQLLLFDLQKASEKSPSAPFTGIPAPKIALVVEKPVPIDLEPTTARHSNQLRGGTEKEKVRNLSVTLCQPMLLAATKSY